TNRSTGLPVPRANVELIGPSPTTWRTSNDGYVEFRNIPAGTYALQMSKRGYDSVRTRRLAVQCARAVSVRASLAPMLQATSAARARVERTTTPPKATHCRFVGKTSGRTGRWLCS
ncbi:MAG: carboxypeptidase regulatory-like domain-containing protein, partial [Candidatus Eremiobacteraeota bacterium]|nr:carboxypeptidase regulatory-like domain-containing protein [Candidatus Eremiobacteraeota bacterium]